MNIFVLSTGRCGSTSFERACSAITNYSCGHETLTHALGSARLAYPERHIESDNRLSWFLGRLDAAYGDSAFYVHLTRDREQVAASYAKRLWPGSIMLAYARGILLRRRDKPEHTVAPPLRSLEVARDYVDTVNSNIRLFLRDKTRKMDFRLEGAETDFLAFWDAIGAEGDLERALQLLGERHNATD
jgi:hypothetical protein